MNTLTALSVTQSNEETYNKLLVSLEAGLGMLQIFIAVCDDDRQREEIIANYERELASIAHPYRVHLDPQEPSLRLAISQQVTVRENVIATVTGTGRIVGAGGICRKVFWLFAVDAGRIARIQNADCSMDSSADFCSTG